jgi:outer membrane protein insertion porin family
VVAALVICAVAPAAGDETSPEVGPGTIPGAVPLPLPGVEFEEVVDRESLERLAGRTIVSFQHLGHSITKDRVIESRIDLAEGQRLDPQVVRADVVRLEDLGIFSSVRVQVGEVEEGGVAVRYVLREMPWIIPYVAFRYTEENGWSVGPALSSVNLFGEAIYLSGRALFGGTNTFEFQYKWPGRTRGFRSDGRLALLVRNDELNGFEEDSFELLPWFTFSPSHRVRLAATGGLFRMGSDVDGITLSPDNRDVLWRFGGRVAWDTRDSQRYPRRGGYNELEVFRSTGDADTWRLNLDLRRYVSLPSAQGITLGWLTTWQSGELDREVPLYYRYFMGGANTIRGYDIDELGPQLAGKNQMILLAQYDWEFLPIREIGLFRWAFALGARLAVFGDAGIAWTASDEFDSRRFKEGVGIGLRLLVPGTNIARLDLAVGESGDVKFHFAVWPKLVWQRERLR